MSFSRADESAILKELDAYWAEVSRSVGAGDFEGYKATCHEEGVLVSGSKESSQPLSDALARWNDEFNDTKSGEMKASVAFRFGERFHDEATAHETGMFLYVKTNTDGVATQEYIEFEALLVKREGKWKILMEYQKSHYTMKIEEKTG
jgi:hypothetical protein